MNRFEFEDFESDAVDAAMLETDIMRFFAILLICLLAIFTLVKTIPMSPEPKVPGQTVAVAENRPATAPIYNQPPVQEIPLSVEKTEAQEETLPDAIAEATTTEVLPSEPLASVEQETLTLQFASDEALMHLLGQFRVRVFVKMDDQWLQVNPAKAFPTEKIPGQLFAMNAGTVPAQLQNQIGPGSKTDSVQWHVWLPADLSQEIQHFVERGEPGRIVIDDEAKATLLPTI